MCWSNVNWGHNWDEDYALLLTAANSRDGWLESGCESVSRLITVSLQGAESGRATSAHIGQAGMLFTNTATAGMAAIYNCHHVHIRPCLAA